MRQIMVSLSQGRKLSIFVIIMTLLLTIVPINYAFSKRKNRIAIMDMRAIGVEKYLGAAVAELLRTRFINDGRFIVVERSLLQKIAKEQKLQMSGLVSTKTAVKIGRLVGANYIIVGSIMKLGSKYILSVRLIDVQTAVSKKSAEIKGTSEDEFDSMCAEALSRLFPKRGETTKPSTKATTRKGKTTYPTYSGSSKSVSAFLRPYKNIIRGLDPSVASMLSKFAANGLNISEKRFILWLAANDPKRQLSVALKYSMKSRITPNDVKKLSELIPAVYDSFTDNHNKWGTRKSSSAEVFVNGGYLYIIAKKKGYFFWTTPAAANKMISSYSRYICKVSAVQEGGNKFSGYYGIVFKMKDNKHFYFFFEDNNGNYNVGEYKNSWISFTGWKKDMINFTSMTAVATTSKVAVYLSSGRHSKRLFEKQISDYPHGFAGIAAGGMGEVRFSSFKIYISKYDLWKMAHLY